MTKILRIPYLGINYIRKSNTKCNVLMKKIHFYSIFCAPNLVRHSDKHRVMYLHRMNKLTCMTSSRHALLKAVKLCVKCKFECKLNKVLTRMAFLCSIMSHLRVCYNGVMHIQCLSYLSCFLAFWKLGLIRLAIACIRFRYPVGCWPQP